MNVYLYIYTHSPTACSLISDVFLPLLLQDQTSYAPAPPPHGPIPANSMASAPGNNSNGLAAPPGGASVMAPGHAGGATYLNSQMAAALKQQQQQQQYMQRQLMAEQVTAPSLGGHRG